MKIRSGLIPAAGQGKRMGYLSYILPKPLLPLGDKPIIHYVIENMEKMGVEEIFIPVYYHREKFVEYFNNVKDIRSNINLIKLKKPTAGIAQTIYRTKNLFNEPFIVILGDDFTIAKSFDNLIYTFFLKKALVVEGMVKEKNEKVLKSTNSVRLNRNKRILEIIEKPQNPISNIRGIGIYIFDPAIFEYIEKTRPSPPRGEIEITNTIGLVAKDRRAFGEFITGINVNINSIDDYLYAWLQWEKFYGKRAKS
jgi:dTDP-glucose pyrophosphorylase